MKLILLTSALLCIIYQTHAEELTLETCKCWTGYEPAKNGDRVECQGKMILSLRPCNVPEPPQCKCTGEVNGILNDGTGTYCSYSVKGENVKKWKCENEEEWTKYGEEYKKYQDMHRTEEPAELAL